MDNSSSDLNYEQFYSKIYTSSCCLNQTVENLNNKLSQAQDILAEICLYSFQYCLVKFNFDFNLIDAFKNDHFKTIKSKLNSCLDLKITDEELDEVINFITNIYRTAIQLKINNDTFMKTLQNLNIFKKQVISSINFVWQRLDGESKDFESQAFHLKSQLVDIEWEIGVNMCSDEAKDLDKSPYINLTLITANFNESTASRVYNKHKFQISIQQLNYLIEVFKSVQTILSVE